MIMLRLISTKKSASLLTFKNEMLPFVWMRRPILHISQGLPEKNQGYMQNWHLEMVVCKGILRRWGSLIELPSTISKALLGWNILLSSSFIMFTHIF